MLTTPLSPNHWYFTATNAHQRDVLWSVFGPALLDCSWSPANSAAWPEHMQTDLLAHIPKPPTYHSPRLGFKFEQLWQSWLTECQWPFWANVQIHDNQRTLGELDLLVQPAAKKLSEDGHTMADTQHWELALKFYLGHHDEWIGPNRQDLLSRKLQHLQQHQLTISKHPAARQQLADLHAQPKQHLAIMRGCLFQAINPALQATLPVEVSDRHWQGFWCHQQDAQRYLPEARWFILAKDQWLSLALAPCAIDTQELLHYVARHFHYLNVGLCIAKVLPCRTGWAEQERWFIMPNHWPYQSGKS